MGGKSKTKYPVADYSMSIHYGLCKGPLDSINQVYVKELPIWCGQATENGTAYVHDPDLFGGDKKEGGVSGAMDFYLGTADQKMSPTSAARYDRTPDTMWGYRGIASILFRGYHPEEVTAKPEPRTVFPLTQAGRVFVSHVTEWVKNLFANPEETPEKSGGFKWTSNNPYLPGAWVNATRIPRGLSDSFAAIYSEDPDYLDKHYAEPVGVNATNYFTIEELGWTPEQIDSGEVMCTASITASFTGVGLGAGTVMDGYVSVQFQGYYDNGLGSPGAIVPLSTYTDGGGVIGAGGKSVTGPIRPGTRHVRFYPQVIRTYPVYSTFAVGSMEHVTFKMIYGPSYCTIDNHLGVLPDANPAHMLYEVLTDTDWGMGEPRSSIDIPNFMAAAERFYNEKFGLSILWTDQMEYDKYSSEILDHVQATLFLDPHTGLWTLIPFRDDYDVETLPVLDPSNCKATNRQRKALGETINEIVVTWTNPNNEQEETIVFQDPGNAAAQGVPVSSARNYYGIRNAALANFVGQRDIRSASYPMFSADISAHRSMSFLRPGSVAKFSWPEDGIVDMPVRVMKVDYGQPGDSAIKLSVTEDVFGLDVTEYTNAQETLWEDPNVAPQPMTVTEVLTAPLPLMLRSGFSLADLSDDQYPAVSVAVLAKQPSGPHVESFDLAGPVVKPTGEVVTDVLATLSPTKSGVTTKRIVDEIVTYMQASELMRFVGLSEPETGDFLLIEGADADRLSEIVMLDSVAGNVWTLARGMFDTVIRDWPIGTRVWALGDSLTALDPTENNAGAETTYQLLPKSSGGRLSLEDAPIVTFTPPDRPYAPFRPANIQLTPIGGTPLTPYPTELANPGAESGTSGWTESNSNTSTGLDFSGTILLPKKGSRFFSCANGAATAYMEQLLSVPISRWPDADAGELEMSLRWWQAGFDSVTDPCTIEVTFYDEADAEISTYTSAAQFGGEKVWVFKYELWTAPPGTRSYKLRFDMVRTDGSNLNCYIDDIQLNLSAGVFPPMGFMGTEVPTALTVSWANRNRLTEDTVAMRWDEATVTPEDGQTTTIRVVDSVSGDAELEVTGLTGTSYDLALGTLVNYRFYRVEVVSVRDGFESIQAAYRNLQVVQLGYGNNYGYDYGENDGG